MAEVSDQVPDAQDFKIGPFSSFNIIGEVTEAIHRRLLDDYDLNEQPPRIEEDLKFVPKDREEVIYIYMYRCEQNQALMNQKRFRVSPIQLPGEHEMSDRVFYHRPPILMDLFYLISVHSKFRSDAERLLGWVMMSLHATRKLIYRPRRFVLPDGAELDSLGRPYDPDGDTDVDGLHVEKVSLALVDDLTIGDAINFYTLNEAPFRPWLTYRARVALDGPLMSTEGGTQISMGDDDGLRSAVPNVPRKSSRLGRIRSGKPVGTIPEPPGPPAHKLRRRFQTPPKSENSED